jgi:urate oxidase
MRSVRLTAREFPFAAVPVPAQDGYTESDRLFSRQYGDHAVATLTMERAAEGVTITDHRVGRVDMELLKVTGSAFTHFVRDANTTLPERGDRPLFVHMDLHWRYADPTDLLDESHARYVPPEQMRDLAQTVFHEFVSESIQHLVHEIGTRALTRYPQLAEVAFEAQNRTPDPAATSDADPRVKVYTAPFPAFGLIRLTIRRDEN